MVLHISLLKNISPRNGYKTFSAVLCTYCAVHALRMKKCAAAAHFIR